MKILRGIAASPGIAYGPAFQLRQPSLHVKHATVEDPVAECERFEAALDLARQQLAEIYGSGRDELADIFRAHALMLEDPELLEAVRTTIREKSLNAEAALSKAAEAYTQALDSLDDEYLRARAVDVRDVADRLLRILAGATETGAADLKVPSIILARDLTPSNTLELDRSLVLGFCTTEGGATSHVAILARGLGLPALVGVEADVLAVPPGTPLVLNGNDGMLLVDPAPDVVATYLSRQAAATACVSQARQHSHELAYTCDGHRVEVLANIGSTEEAQAALQAGAEGVGLLRTEFLYMRSQSLPAEEEQYRAYRSIVDVFGQRPVILRTLDIGGDKALAYLELPREANPFLGQRGIRLCLKRQDLIRPQLRAALRAGHGANLKLMLPMVASVGEVRAARELIEACRAGLQSEGHPVASKLEIGVMVETPAAALMADQLAAEADFLSIGTNDLSQYTMAADRTNAEVASLAAGPQPAVLRLIASVVAAAHQRDKPVGLCGELAGDLATIPVLVGLGIDELSMSPAIIPLAKHVIRTLSFDQAQDLARWTLEAGSADEVLRLVAERVPAVSDVRVGHRCGTDGVSAGQVVPGRAGALGPSNG